MSLNQFKYLTPFICACFLFHSTFAKADKTVLIEEINAYLEFVDYGGSVIFAEQIPELEYKKIFIIDARDVTQFKKSHIPGAHNIEWRQVLQQRQKIPKDRMVLIYCNTGSLSAQAGLALRLSGYENVRILQGGYEEWKAKGGLKANQKASQTRQHWCCSLLYSSRGRHQKI